MNNTGNGKDFQDNNKMNFDINADSDVPGISHLDESMNNDPELERLQTELAELKDKYLRQAAEFDNFRKRSAKEKLELIQTAGKDVITSFLDVLDDTERAQKQLQSSTDVSGIKEGIMLVFNKLRNTFQSKGVKAMESINQDFDPDMHEAITEVPAPTPEMKGKVVDEVQKGYLLNDKIIRFAKVVVGK